MGAGGWEGRLRYWLAEHPRVAKFRWDHDEWGSTWVFPVVSIFVYLAGILLLKLAMRKRKGAIPLGPIPAIHNSIGIILCVGIFMGCWEATAVEMEMASVWRKAKGKWNWVICFPLGTRPTGSVFFWSYLFYLTKYHQLFDTAIHILHGKPLTFLHVFQRILVVFMCFVWLEFSQSLQIVAILGNTVVSVMRFSYELCRNTGLRWAAPLPSPVKCQVAECVFTVVAYAALLSIHFRKREGCNGMGAWLFNALLNAALFLLCLHFYAKRRAAPSSPAALSIDCTYPQPSPSQIRAPAPSL